MTFSTPIQLILLTSLMILSSCTPTSPSQHNTSKITYPATDRRPFLKTGNTSKNRLLWLIDSGATQSFLFIDGTNIPNNVTLGKKTTSSQIHGLLSKRQTSSTPFKFTGQNHPPITGYTLGKKETSRAVRYDGIIGLHTLRKERAILSISHKQLIWQTSPRTSTGIRLSPHPTSGHLLLSAIINGSPVKLIVDTGAARSILSSRTASRLGLKLRPSNHSVSGVYRTTGRSHRTQDIGVTIAGSQKTFSTQFTVVDLSNVIGVKGMGNIDGLIGYDFLQRHFSSIDFVNGQLNF